jgi:hypothetical protein
MAGGVDSGAVFAQYGIRSFVTSVAQNIQHTFSVQEVRENG